MAMLFCLLWFGHSCVSCYILTAAVSWWQHVIHPPLSNELSIVKCDLGAGKSILDQVNNVSCLTM